MKEGKRPQKKKLACKIEPNAIVHIWSTFNNTLVTVANRYGEVITFSSAGKCGFKGTKKGTPYAAAVAAETAANIAKKYGVKSVKVYLKGAGFGRETALRALAAAGLEIEEIIEATPIPHGGCRPPKPRRV